MSEVPDLFRRSIDEFGRRVAQIKGDQWHNATPCTEWDVRVLVNHIVNENRWVPPLLDGKTIEEVGDRFDGDLLGDDPNQAWKESSEEALDASKRDGAMETTTHLSFGDFPGSDYITQVAVDHIIHSWDLARGIGADDTMDPDLVQFAYDYFLPQADAWRAGGAFGELVDVPESADPQTRLLALTGRKR